jgi:hypothetical protein
MDYICVEQAQRTVLHIKPNKVHEMPRYIFISHSKDRNSSHEYVASYRTETVKSTCYTSSIWSDKLLCYIYAHVRTWGRRRFVDSYKPLQSYIELCISIGTTCDYCSGISRFSCDACGNYCTECEHICGHTKMEQVSATQFSAVHPLTDKQILGT